VRSSLGEPLNALKHVLRLGSALALGLGLGCSDGTVGLDAAGSVPDSSARLDAGFEDARVVVDAAVFADATAFADATLFPDAARSPDASEVPDAAGCFETPVRVWTSTAGPMERAHGRIQGAAGTEDGWLVAVNGLHDGEQLISTDRRGHIQWVNEIDFYGQTARMFAIGRSLYVFHGQLAERLDIDATGITRRYNSVYVGGLTERGEQTLTVSPLEGEEGFRAISLHFDVDAGRWLVRVSELRPSATETSGISHVTGRLELPPDLPVEAGQYYLAGDHLWVLVRAAEWRVLDVQLGLGGLGSAPVVPARVWSDEIWPMSPPQVIELTGDRTLALTARPDSVTMANVGQLERLPPAAPAITTLGPGLDLGFGLISAAMLEVNGRLVIATPRGIWGYASDGTPLLSSPIEATPNIPLGLARHLGEVAVFYVEANSEERHVSIKCATVP